MITGFRLKQGGFLQADILLTSPKGTLLPISEVPTLKGYEAGGFALHDHVVTGLCQKILVANDHFAVAFAGDVSKIRDTVSLIKSLIAESPALTSARFLNAFSSNKELAAANLSLIVLTVADDEGWISNFNAEDGPSSEHFDMCASGSGAQHAIDYYDQFYPEVFDVDEEDIVVFGTCMALNQFASYLIHEYEDQIGAKTIADLFGGGFEVAAYYGGKINKISDVVYAYAEAEIDAKGILQIEVPNFLLKSAYEGELLKIRSLEIYGDAEDDYKKRHDRTFTIAPIMSSQESCVEVNSEDMRFSGNFLCFLIKVKMSLGSFIIPFVRKYDTAVGFTTKAFVLVPSSEGVHIVYSPVFEEELHNHVLEYIRQDRD